MIRGLGLYTPDDVLPLDELDPQELSTDEQLDVRLRDLRTRCDQLEDGFIWIGLFEPTRAELDLVTRVFDIPLLLMEDAANPDQRPKFELDDEGHGLAVVKILDYLDATSDVTTGQVSVYGGDRFAVTVRFGRGSDLRPIRARLQADGHLRSHGALAVLYTVLDGAVDGYLAVSEEIAIDVEALETEIFAQTPSVGTTNSIYRLKRENVEIRRAVQPLVGWAHEAVNERLGWLPDELRPYFRDIGDHLLRAHDATESADSLLLAMLMASTSLQDLQQNRDMRKISAWVAIAAVPTAMAGIYGMNFDDMPELQWSLGYPAVLVLMGTICALLYRGFRRSGWL